MPIHDASDATSTSVPDGVYRRQVLALGVAAATAMTVPAFAASRSVRPFKVAIPDAQLKAIRAGVASARLPRPMLDDSWSTGMSVAWLTGLREYWLTKYDWRAAEARINRHPQFVTEIDGNTVHFYHVRGKGPSPTPVLIGHGWPYSIFSFADVIDRLTDPARFGGDPRDALTVVIPSMPGYGFSSLPQNLMGPVATSRMWRKLMVDVLGYPRFGLQGGDIGCLTSTYAAAESPRTTIGLHLNLAPDNGPPPGAMSVEEEAWRAEGAAFTQAEFDYMRAQGNKPMMVGAALEASPMAAASWIAEKYWAWADHGGDLDSVISKDKLLTEIMAYVATDTIATSFGMYRMVRDEIHYKFHPGPKIGVPTGVYLGPKEYIFGRPPRFVLERSYNLARLTSPARGGHFPFLEQPIAFSDDLLAFYRERRT